MDDNYRQHLWEDKFKDGKDVEIYENLDFVYYD